ncbi:MAG: hypothetical protein HYR96_00650 [Deltaproteobacteria bacterium]|nr:hypothetical protein [Deltaproteobacteria bacterium]
MISELTDVREERRGIISDEDLKGDPVYVAWSEKNGRLFDLCSSNHGFIERSLGRQAQLLDNLRKLMGGPAIYSKQGEFAHTPSSGRVVAGRY